MNTLVAIRLYTGPDYAPMKSTTLVASGTLVANTSSEEVTLTTDTHVLIKGVAGLDVQLMYGVPYYFESIDLSTIYAKSNTFGDAILSFIGQSGP